MTWYEEAAKAMGEDVIDVCYDDDAPLGRNEINIKKAAAIIAAHDPNRWVPVEERLPKFNVRVEGFRCTGSIPRIYRVFFDGERFWHDSPMPLEIPVTHWREIVLPEVKG